MRKKRERRISVLLIPDDNAEPYSFRLSWTTAKIMLGIAVVLVLHMVAGALGYFQLSKISRENTELERSNTRLLEDNKRVYRLAALLEEMDKDQGKIMSLLGVENRNGQRGNVKMSMASGGGASPEMELDAASPEMTLSAAEGEAPAELRGNFLRANKTADARVPPHWPSLLPVEGYLSRAFSRNPWFPFEEHLGIDIAGKQGSVVMAAGDGYVLYAGWHLELGNVVILHHGEGLFSLYGHNDRLLVREREYVPRGTAIALLGNSGRSSGPHLHFEIWQDGQVMDPRQYVLAFRSEPRIAAK